MLRSLCLVILALRSPAEGAESADSIAGTICPSGWIDADDLGCFMFLESAVNLFWVEAQQKCETFGGYLAEPLNAKKAEFLHGVGNIYETISGIKHWWIGLSDLGKEGHWVWSTSGANLTESFWGPYSPNTNHSNTDDCAVMVVEPDSFWWEDTSCLTTEVQQHRVAPICQRERISIVSCPSGFAPFDNHCYMVTINVALPWQDAENDCINRGGHLASIHSKAEGDFIYNLASNSTGFVWIGANDISSEGKWVWTDGSKWDYTNWVPGQPSNSNQNCAGFRWIPERKDTWDDHWCNEKFLYACKTFL